MTPPTTNIDADRGDDIDILIGPVELPDPITNAVTPVDLTAVGIELRFTVKDTLADTDANARVRLGNAVTGLTGVTPNQPATTDRNYATAHIPHANVEGLPDHAIDLHYDVQLVEASGRKTTLQRGLLRFGPDVTRS